MEQLQPDWAVCTRGFVERRAFDFGREDAAAETANTRGWEDVVPRHVFTEFQQQTPRGNVDDVDDLEAWARFARRSRARWLKDNPF